LKGGEINTGQVEDVLRKEVNSKKEKEGERWNL